MKIFSADAWTIEELKDQIDDAGRRAVPIPAADTRRAVLATSRQTAPPRFRR
ncbi:hypothetical protein [Pseudarthrobacter sp. S9]|uniref:hypothetical protein n=1 Tax=Pseudarthrobacter sp. S9 TaxID=3418421 RepID=UPI003D05FBD6